MEAHMNDYPIVTDENGVPRAPVPPSLVTVTRVVYALHALSILIGVFTGASIATAFVFGWPSIIAVIINYVERSDVRGTYLDSHFSWQIRTFCTRCCGSSLFGSSGLRLPYS